VSPFEVAVRRQHERLGAALAAGMPRLGWKICVNEPTNLRRLRLDQPFVGYLDGARRFGSGDTCHLAPDGVYAVEPEIAIQVGEPPASIAALAPALEIVDYTRGAFTLAGVVESSSFHHGVVLGASRPPGSAPTLGPGCPRLLHDGVPAATPDPALVPADLSEIVRRVAAFLAERGQELRAADWILSGACTAPVRVGAGERVEADFDTLGGVAVRFAPAAAS
jgi:2-keto-4-pentenoate hydratase